MDSHVKKHKMCDTHQISYSITYICEVQDKRTPEHPIQFNVIILKDILECNFLLFSLLSKCLLNGIALDWVLCVCFGKVTV